MNKPLAVCVVDTLANREEDSQAFEWGSKAVVVILQCAVLIVRHDEVRPLATACFSKPQASHDVGMVEALGQFDLLKKAVFAIFPRIIQNFRDAFRPLRVL